MRVLKGTLTFILGMVLGIILFVLAIGGAVFAIGSSMTVGQLQESLTQEEVIAKDSALYSQKLIDAIKSIVGDVKNIKSLSLKTLYEHYGISVLNGISGIDFTEKEFYSLPISELIGDTSKIVNSFTLSDISKIADVDFSSYGLPVLDDNLNNNVKTALNNIMSSLNGDLTIRSINDKFGIDIGVGENALLAAVQDVALSNFGSVVNAMMLDKILNVDSDTFVKVGENDVYVKADGYDVVSNADLQNSAYTAPVGVETYIAGATDSDNDGTADTLVEKELRFVKKITQDADGNEVVKYVVDNSCYATDFNAETNEKEFYRHVQYEKYSGASDEYFVLSYANKIVEVGSTSFTLYTKGFLSLNDVYVSVGGTVVPFGLGVSGAKITLGSALRKTEEGNFENSERYFVFDVPVDKNTKLRAFEDGTVPVYTDCYERVHVGSSEQILQLVAYMTVTELQNADDLLNSLTVGDVVSSDSSKLVNALKDCKLKDIGTKINTLKIDDVIDINDESSIAMKSLAAHGATLDNIDTIVNELSIGELMEVTYDVYQAQADGDYVKVDLFVPYNEYLEIHKTAKTENGLFVKDASGNYVSTTDETGDVYVNIGRYTLYDSEKHTGLDRYALTSESATSITIQSMARRGYLIDEIGTKVDSLCIDELIRIKADSAVIMRSLAKRGTTLNKFADVADELKLSEVIEISADSARIMKSLVARDCLIKDLDKIANDLTLSETVDVKFDQFTPNASGKYVKVVGDGYVFYDSENVLMQGMQRFKKDSSSSPAVYTADENGSFVHDFYFTLYNIATHSDATLYARYDRTVVSGASSKVLQRLAFSNVGEFSTAFDALTLGDVIDIDPDVLEVADADYKLANPTVTYYAYDETNHVFKRDETGVYYVSRAGESSAVLKRLAFVPVNSLSTALDAIIKDMLLSELIDVYEQYAVSIDTAYNPTSTPASTIQETDRFIVKPLGYDESGKAYTFVYNQFGKYIARDYAFIQTPVSQLTVSGSARFEYVKLNSAVEATIAMSNGGVYYKHGEEYVSNTALCVYLASLGKFDNLYTRNAVTSGGIEVETYSDADLYVEISGVYTPYDSTKLTHLGFSSYFVKQTKTDGTKFYVSTTTPNASDDNYYQYWGKDDDGNSKEPLYSKEYCENIYVKSATGAYVFNGNEYVAYDASKHDGLDRFEQVVGYLATANETYVKVSGAYAIALPHTQYMVAREGGMIREKSQAVIRMLATKEVTIANIDSVIKTATIGEILDVTPDSIFEKFADSTIDNLNLNLQSTITEMSVGELMEFAGVSTSNPIVRSALKDVKLKDFFSSLTFRESVGIVIDMEKACGYTK